MSFIVSCDEARAFPVYDERVKCALVRSRLRCELGDERVFSLRVSKEVHAVLFTPAADLYTTEDLFWVVNPLLQPRRLRPAKLKVNGESEY